MKERAPERKLRGFSFRAHRDLEGNAQLVRDHTVSKEFGIGVRPDNDVAGGDFEREAGDLSDLNADDDIACASL
jgi:hypothetical protein